MFKRVVKRERKREKEEDLGLDEDMKQVLGLQDTDSDESSDSSESDDHSDDASDSGEEIDDEDVNPTDHRPHKQKRLAQRAEELSGSESVHEESDSSHVENEVVGDDSGGSDDGPPMSVLAATTDPLYDLPNATSTQDLRACIICPGKVIKNSKMAKIHLESTAHLRRLQRYNAEVSKRVSSGEGLNTDDPRDILRDMSGTINYGAQLGTSKRSQRRAQWKDNQVERRRIKKEKKRRMAVEKSMDKDYQNSEDGGTIQEKATAVKNNSGIPARTGVSGVFGMVEFSNGRKPVDRPQKASLRSGPVELSLDDDQHVRPKKRQKRATTDRYKDI